MWQVDRSYYLDKVLPYTVLGCCETLLCIPSKTKLVLNDLDLPIVLLKLVKYHFQISCFIRFMNNLLHSNNSCNYLQSWDHPQTVLESQKVLVWQQSIPTCASCHYWSAFCSGISKCATFFLGLVQACSSPKSE
jgi:hypothetical protein